MPNLDLPRFPCGKFQDISGVFRPNACYSAPARKNQTTIKPKPEIVEWAEAHSLKLEDWIKREREQASQWNKTRDERFE
jgi:hypothetical protein